jgi:hypothetical protein
MEKYLYVEFADIYNAWLDAQMGFTTASRKRIKKIKLTDEQVKELQPQITGTSGGEDMFEQVSVICIQEE